MLAYSIGFTGLAIHEWLGLGLGFVLVVHSPRTVLIVAVIMTVVAAIGAVRRRHWRARRTAPRPLPQ